MNWMSTKSSPSEVSRWLADDRSDRCDHVEESPQLAYAVLCEDDSFGPVNRYVVCEQCYRDCLDEEDAREVVCRDCKKVLPMGECFEWKWYDFYAPQGDEPLIICLECEKLPRHKQRVAEDNKAYNEEMAYYDSRHASWDAEDSIDYDLNEEDSDA